MKSAKYILAIGNPGSIHAKQYHNLGIIFANYLIEKLPNTIIKKQKEYELFKFDAQNQGIDGLFYDEFFLIKSLVFMNNSFDAIREIYNLYKLCANNFLVMHDELMIPKFQIKIKTSPGNAGHNGLRDLSNNMENNRKNELKNGEKNNNQNEFNTFARLRIGIDHPKNFNPNLSVHNYVLSNIDNLEEYRLAFEKHALALIIKWVNEK